MCHHVFDATVVWQTYLPCYGMVDICEERDSNRVRTALGAKQPIMLGGYDLVFYEKR